ncbi:hypothetical protein [Nostoc sp.]|uniref:glutaredoxin family protein n=1 Tax=Nostoc sp. TaxID=1180 RepID=UPI002FF362CB
MKTKIWLLSLAATLTLFTTAAKAQQPEIPHSESKISLSTSNLDLIAANTKSAIKNTSGKAEIALARYLKKIKAKFYGAFWCPYCARQKELFGKAAFTNIKYIECDPRGENPRPRLCQQASVRSYPTWEINGRLYTGVYSLNDLANISGYRGQRNFKY